jgi:hypothetical protein
MSTHNGRTVGDEIAAMAPPSFGRVRRFMTSLAACSLVLGTLALGAVVTASPAGATTGQGLVTLATTALPSAYTGADTPPSQIGSNARIYTGQNAISCASAALCVAIGGNAGGYSSVIEGSGSSWSTISLPAVGVEATAVSCAPGTSPTLCIIVGVVAGTNPGDAPSPAIFSSTNGTTWLSDAVPGTMANLEDVACPSTTRCVAVGVDDGGGASNFISSDGVLSAGALTWNSDTTSLSGSSGFLDAVSCTSATFCVAATGDASGPDLLRMGTGTGVLAWSTATIPSTVSGASLQGVSCTATTGSPLCVAWGFNGAQSAPISFVWSTTDGSTWTDATPGDLEATSFASQASPTQGGSCGSTGASTLCAVVGENLDFESVIYTSVDGTNWNEQALPAGLSADASVTGVTCISSSSCIAWGQNPQVSGPQQPLLIHGANGPWTTDTAPTQLTIPDQVICVSASICNAVGLGPAPTTGEQTVMTFNGTVTAGAPTWSAAATRWPDVAGAFAPAQVSACAGTTTCVNVGTNGDLSTINVGSGAAAAVTLPTAAVDASFVGVSCAGTLCVAAGNEQAVPGNPATASGGNVAQEFPESAVLVRSTNETTWSSPVAVTLPADYTLQWLGGVSCATDSSTHTLCAATGQARFDDGVDPAGDFAVVVTSTDGGAHWTGQVSGSPEQNLVLSSVDCASSTFCATTGTDGNDTFVGVVTAAASSLTYTDLGSNSDIAQPSLSCEPLVTTCVLVADSNNDNSSVGFSTTNGTTWSGVTLPSDFAAGTFSVLSGITCTTGLCVAFGAGQNGPELLSSTDAATFTDATISAFDNFTGVSCSSANYCVAIEQNQGALGSQSPVVSESTDGAGATWDAVDSSNAPADLTTVDSFVCPVGLSTPTCLLSANSTTQSFWLDTALAATAPGAPTLSSATPGNTQVTLNWTAPVSNGGATITGYNVLRGTTTGGESVTPIATGVTGLTYTDPGRTNGTPYFYEVEAVNSVGTSVASNELSATPTTTIPGAPTLTAATPSNAQVVLNWTAPVSNGGATITGYNVLRGTTTGGESVTPIATGVAGLTFTDTGRINGTTYFYEVEAVNSVGASVASNELSATPANVPGAPTITSAVAGNASVTLTWTAPGSNGGATITGYNVLRGTTTGGESVTPIATGVSGLTYTDNGRTNGTTYFYEVEAVNPVGPSGPSNESSATPGATVPGVATITSATPSNGLVVLNWTAPTTDGGTTITGYNVLRGTTTGGESLTPIATGVSGLTYTDNGRTNGVTYFYEVEAVNSVGASAPSNEVSATPGAIAPGVPAITSAVAGNASVTVTWTAPISNGGSAITNYRIVPFIGATAQTPVIVGNVLSDIVTGLVNGTTYTFTVAATNTVGTSSASSPSSSATPVTVPGAPGLTSATSGNAQVTLAWTAPTSNGGSTITGYTVLRGTTTGGESVVATGVTGLTFTDTGRTNGTTYFYEVEAVNSVGASTPSNERSATPATVPAAPTFSATPVANADGTVGVTWGAPANNGAPITTYTVTPTPACSACGGLTISGSPASASTTITGLTGGTAYTFTVRATNLVGTSPASASSNPVTPLAPAPSSAPAGATSSANCTSQSASGSCPVTDEATTATATGEGSLTVAQYSGTPAGTSSLASATSYFDVNVAAGSSFATITVTDCNLGGGDTLEWWNGSAWAAVTPESLAAGPPACATVTLSSLSSPTIAQLTGTVFAVATSAALSGKGYWEVATDGGIFAFGNAGFFGSMGGKHLDAPIVGIATTPDGKGYWEVATDGGIFAFGDAAFFGSMGAKHLNAPIVGIATTPDGKGYWEVATDGGIFAFGDAAFFGSMGAKHLNAPIVGIATTPDGKGYWLVASDGGVFSFGNAAYHGSMGGQRLAKPIVGIATSPSGSGYREVASDGGIFAFGDAGFFGSMGGKPLTKPIVGISTTPSGSGYWEVASDGGIFTFGDAGFYGSTGAIHLVAPVVGIAAS